MKLKRSIMCLLVLTFLLTSCGKKDPKTYESTITIPHSFDYGSSQVDLVDSHIVEVYQNYEYSYYLLAKMDLSKLSDKDFHYFFKDNIIKATCMIPNELYADSDGKTIIPDTIVEGNNIYFRIRFAKGLRDPITFNNTNFSVYFGINADASSDNRDSGYFVPDNYAVTKYDNLPEDEKEAMQTEDSGYFIDPDKIDRSETF